MTLAIGSRIGAFEITGTLGAGGMGEVYRARDTRLDRDVAIKVLPELSAHDPERLGRFEREAKALASLNDPNIAAIFGLEESSDVVSGFSRTVQALVLELVEGPTLADRIAQGPLPLDEAMPIAKQLADALQAAHDLGVIHRDLKPPNIKLRPDGTVKVLDFGLAKISAPHRAYSLLRLSSDGTKVALDIRDQGNDLWTWDLARQVLTQVTFDPSDDRNPVWVDNERIIFASARTGVLDLYEQRADGTGSSEAVLATGRFTLPTSASSDGTVLVFNQDGNIAILMLDAAANPPRSTNQHSGATLSQGAERRVRQLTNTTWTEDNGEISPDGHWLAYQSAEEGRMEMFVRSFPDFEKRLKISTSGGTKPVWARNGRELFYLDASDMLTSVPVQTGSTFTAGKPVRILNSAYYAGTNRSYDVSPDGQRFLMIKENAPAGPSAPPAGIVVVLNWLEELKKLIPSK